MIAIIIIILVCVAWYYWMDAKHTKEVLIIEKSKIRNFESLINKLVNIDEPGYKIIHRYENEVKFQKTIAERTVKILTLKTLNEKLAVGYILWKGPYKPAHSKYFSFTIYDSADYIAKCVKIGIIAFESELLLDDPEILK